MKPAIRATAALLALTVTAFGCAGPNGGRLALETFGRGLMGLVLSPIMIATGILQGLAFLPYTIGTGLAELNRGLIAAHAVSLDDAYKASYGVSINDPRVNQRTGAVAGEYSGFGRHRPEAMLEATRALQRLLVAQGMPADKAEHYVLTGVYTHARTRGHLLIALVYRHPGMQPFQVAAKHTGIVTTFRPEQMGWREAYERDTGGSVVDEVIDWVALEYPILRQEKVVATLMVLAAEAVKSGNRSADYWDIERRWIAGDTVRIIHEAAARVKLEPRTGA
ncbi:MAG: hypothetical protein ACRD09_12550 [Vicinamibacterales bacterium]